MSDSSKEDLEEQIINWDSATWEGNRREQQLAFQELSFEEKLSWLENVNETIVWFQSSGDTEK